VIGLNEVAELLGIEKVGGASVCVMFITKLTEVTPLLVEPLAHARAFIVCVCVTDIVEPLAIEVLVPPGVQPEVVVGFDPSVV